MSKQIYIDSNGNEVQVSGTVNTADMLPIEAGSSKMTSEAIGDLTTLTTSVTSSLVGAINEIASYTPVYGNTASGAIATFDTSLALPLQDCTIEINAVQSGSGTPSPDNVRPITGFTECNVFVSGVNLWDEVWELGYINVANGTNSPSQINIRSKNYIPIKPNISLYLKAINNAYCPIIFYDKDKNFLSSITKSLWDRTITTPENAYYMRFYMHDSYGTTYNNDISINYPSSDTQYHSYNGNTYTVDFGQTVYGGLLDVTTGLLTVTWAYIDTWTNVNFTFNGSTATYTEVRCALPNAKAYGTSNMKSNKLETGPADLYKINGRANTEYMHFDVPLCANAVEAKQWIIDNGIAVIYELATPQTIQLTPTQVSAIVGTNNIFTDTNGNTSVVYACSLKDYIEGQ